MSVAAGLVALPGCGVSSQPEPTQGRQLFIQNCGSCHTLDAAGTKGNIGPNLDNAFKESVANGLGRSTIKGVVKDQIAYPQGPEMPANVVKGDEAKQVAEFVSQAVKP